MNQQATLSSSLLAKFPALGKIRALPKPILLGAAAAVVALGRCCRDVGQRTQVQGPVLEPGRPRWRCHCDGARHNERALPLQRDRHCLAGSGRPRLRRPVATGFTRASAWRLGRFRADGQRPLRRQASSLSRSTTSAAWKASWLVRSKRCTPCSTRRVHLAMPRQSLFVRERQAPTASVLLNVYPGRSLSDAQVSAISWLVASSVPELTAENVSIVDQNGRLLSAPLGEGRGHGR